MRCTYCGSVTHLIKYCPLTYSGGYNRIHLRCTYCGEKTHTKEGCEKRYGVKFSLEHGVLDE